MRKLHLAKLTVWLAILVFCFFFWFGFYALLASEYRLEMPPDRYNYVPQTEPIIVFANLAQTDVQCRNESMAAMSPGQVCYGCAMRIVGGEHKGRHLIYVATDAPVPWNIILRHEYGHVNGWRHAADARQSMYQQQGP